MSKLSKLYNWISDHIYWGIFLAFISLQCYIHSFVVLFGDDYYYATFLKSGTDHFINQTIYHYMHDNGRAFVNLLDEVLIANGPNLWRIWNVAVIAGIVILIAKISAKEYSGVNKKDFSKALVIACVLFSILEIGILSKSVYWATGALNYLFPILLLLAFYYFYMKNIVSGKKYLWLPILAFFAAFTMEQFALCVIALNVYFLVTCFFIRKERIRPVQIVAFVGSILGSLIIYAAPGNIERTGLYPDFFNLSIVDRIKHSALDLYEIIFGHGGMYIFIMLSLVILAFIAFHKKFAKNKLVNFMLKGIIILLSAATLGLYMWLFRGTNAELTNIPFVILLFLSIALLVIFSIYDYFKKENQDNAIFILLALGIQAAMLLSPEIGARTLLISVLLLFIPLINYTIKYFNNIIFIFISVAIIAKYANADLKLVAIIALTLIAIYLIFFMKKFEGLTRVSVAIGLIAVAIAFSTLVAIGSGYAENYVVHMTNAEKVAEYKAEGNFDKELALSKLPNDIYKYTMPYNDSFHMTWYKILNDLPPNTTITFK